MNWMRKRGYKCQNGENRVFGLLVIVKDMCTLLFILLSLWAFFNMLRSLKVSVIKMYHSPKSVHTKENWCNNLVKWITHISIYNCLWRYPVCCWLYWAGPDFLNITIIYNIWPDNNCDAVLTHFQYLPEIDKESKLVPRLFLATQE